ncbi:hypothetical protein V8D89_001591 [Ganoderma adspersum]
MRILRLTTPLRGARLWTAHALLFAAVVLLFTTFISLGINVWMSYGTPPAQGVNRSKTLDQYTYVGEDYPAYHPIDIPPAILTPENTIHYQIYTEEAAREWASIFPNGGGFLRLGPDGRLFGLALFHQMHCLARIRRAMSIRRSSEHVHHCFNYLRQAIMCEANPTLEPVIPILGRRSVNAEIPHACRDWTKVYELAEEQFGRAETRRDGDEGLEPVYV